MAEFPAFPLFTDAYLGDTKHLTTIEHGAYLLLLICMWRTADKRLPHNPKLLARYCGLTNWQWRRIEPTLMAFFDVEGGFITQGRLTDESLFVRQQSARQSNNAKARWLKNKKMIDAMAIPNACQTDAPHPHPTLGIERKKEAINGNGRGRGKPRHHQMTKDHKRIWLDVGTDDFIAYSQDYRHKHHAPVVLSWGQSGAWFNMRGE